MTGKYLYWLAVEESKPVAFSDLAALLASAIHPSDAMAMGAAIVHFESELPMAVRRGELVVRNPLDMGVHSFPVGAALDRAVLLPHDLRPFLDARSIELRLIPHGSGPKYWTLENAVAAIAEQEGLHANARHTLFDQFVEAANAGKLIVRNPQTTLPETSGLVRGYYELVTPEDVNSWLDTVGARFRWQVALKAATPAPLREVDGPMPLPTSVLANCFAGLVWDTPEKWKKPLGDVPKWIEHCRVGRGLRGKSESTWDPVLLGAALVEKKGVKANSVRAKFQTRAPLKPWFDAWKTYEADNFDVR